MIKALINGIFGVMLSIASIFTAPISSILTNYFPTLTGIISSMTNLVNLFIGSIPYFAYMIPPLTKATIYMIFTFWITQQPLVLVIRNVSQSLDLLKRINIFTSR